MKRLYDPPAFQGKVNLKNYFEGWYYKLVSADESLSMAFIPGISLSPDNKHAFVQSLDGKTRETHYFSQNISTVSFPDKSLITIGPNSFFRDSLEIDLKNKDAFYRGKIKFNGIQPFPRSILSPGIMGWYSFVPFMECYHGVVSMNHHLCGTLETHQGKFSFERGKGYIEKDWGKSFPSGWVWLQGNHFRSEEASFMFSIARIPWLGSFFIGFLSFLKIDDSVFRFATYTGAKYEQARIGSNDFSIRLFDRHHCLEIKAESALGGNLKGPKMGLMDRHIKESVDAKIKLILKKKTGRTIWNDQSTSGGMEVSGDIRELLA